MIKFYKRPAKLSIGGVSLFKGQLNWTTQKTVSKERAGGMKQKDPVNMTYPVQTNDEIIKPLF